MTNAEGKTIDPSKVKVRFNKFESHGVRKTIAGMNADRSAISLSLDDRFIIRHSNEPLYHGNDDYYSRYLFYFDIIIEKDIRGGMTMARLKDKIKSDEAAALSGEMLMLIAMSVFAVLAIIKYILGPIQDSAKAIGKEIGEMGPDGKP